jgi:hypothetical protein
MVEIARFPTGKACVSLKDIQAFQKAVEDHGCLSEYLPNLRTSGALSRAQQSARRIEATRAFLPETAGRLSRRLTSTQASVGSQSLARAEQANSPTGAAPVLASPPIASGEPPDSAPCRVPARIRTE